MDLQELLGRARSGGHDDTSDMPDLQIPDDASSLDDTLPPDPKPGKAKRQPLRAPRTGAPKATAGQRRQVEDSLMMMMQLLGGGLSFRDQVCGPAINENAANIAKAASPIICRNPAMLAWFVGGTGIMDLMALCIALQPVAMTIGRHHITHSIGHDHGQEEVGPVDYSAYGAPAI